MYLTVGAESTLYDIPLEIKSELMNSLTLKNPAYLSAQKYSPYNRIVNIPKNIYYYRDNEDGSLTIPRGVISVKDFKVKQDERVKDNSVDYPEFKYELRETQRIAYENYMEKREEGKGLFVIPTGKGKSILGIYLAYKLKKKCLVVVHKTDLIESWKNDCKETLGLRPKQIGIIKSKEFRLGRWITLATIQTLSRLSLDQIEELRNYFSMVIVDEVHHCPANTFSIVSTFPAYDRIGLTATKIRNDGLGKVIDFYFGGNCFKFIEKEDDEDIIPFNKVNVNFIKYEGKFLGKNLNYFGVKKFLINSEEYNFLIVKNILKEVSKNKSCLILCSEKKHCKILFEMLSKYISKGKIILFYGDSKNDIKDLKLDVESKKILVTIATYSIAKEGTNVRAWERLFLGMSLKNELDIVQAIGRGRRIFEGKKDLIVYDFYCPYVLFVNRHIHFRLNTYKKYKFNLMNNPLAP